MEKGKGIYWIKSEGQTKLATENLVPGNKVYKEKLVVKKGIEYRMWDPFRSKLAAAIINELDTFPFKEGSNVLYIGASTGTTASHISDIIGPQGKIFAVEHTSRVARDFMYRVASHRTNVIPIIQDAKWPEKYLSIYDKVEIVYTDIAQITQTEIAIKNCELYLKKDGHLFLIIKPRSIDVTQSPKKIINEEIDKLRKKFEILETIDLHPYDIDHAIVIAKFTG